MTKINNKKTCKNVHSHIDKAFEIIDEFLPYPYVERVKKHTKGSSGTIRNVRSKREGNIQIIEALLKVALENKKLIEKNNKKIENLINQ